MTNEKTETTTTVTNDPWMALAAMLARMPGPERAEAEALLQAFAATLPGPMRETGQACVLAAMARARLVERAAALLVAEAMVAANGGRR